MTTLVLPQARIPLAWVQVNGVRTAATIDMEWMRSLTVLVDRAGGATGVSTTEIIESSFEDAGIQEAEALAYTNRDAVDQLPSHAELMARVSVLESEIRGIKQGLML